MSGTKAKKEAVFKIHSKTKKKGTTVTGLEVKLAVDVESTTLVKLLMMAIEKAEANKNVKCTSFFPKHESAIASLCVLVKEDGAGAVLKPADHEKKGKKLSKHGFKNGQEYTVEIRNTAKKLKKDDKHQSMFAANAKATEEAEKESKTKGKNDKLKKRGLKTKDDDDDMVNVEKVCCEVCMVATC